MRIIPARLCAHSSADAAALIRQLVDAGELSADPEARVYVYRIARGQTRVAGVVAAVEVSGIDRGAGACAAAAWREPAVAIYDDPSGDLATFAAEDMNQRPIFHFQAQDGSIHTAWLVQDQPRYASAFAALKRRAELVAPGAKAGDGCVLALLIARGQLADQCCGAQPLPRCGLFVQSSALAPLDKA